MTEREYSLEDDPVVFALAAITSAFTVLTLVGCYALIRWGGAL